LHFWSSFNQLVSKLPDPSIFHGSWDGPVGRDRELQEALGSKHENILQENVITIDS